MIPKKKVNVGLNPISLLINENNCVNPKKEVSTILGAHVVYRPHRPQLHLRSVVALQQRQERMERPVRHHLTLGRLPRGDHGPQVTQGVLPRQLCSTVLPRLLPLWRQMCHDPCGKVAHVYLGRVEQVPRTAFNIAEAVPLTMESRSFIPVLNVASFRIKINSVELRQWQKVLLYITHSHHTEPSTEPNWKNSLSYTKAYLMSH